MKANIIPALLVGILIFHLFRRIYLGCSSVAARTGLILTAAVLSVPAVLFASNQLLLIPRAAWFRELHAIPGAEVSSGLIGALLGIMYASAKLRPGELNRSILMVCTTGTLAMLIAPFGTQLVFSLNYSALRNEWKDGVCLQTSGYTCVLASTATVVHALGGNLTEQELAKAAGTTYNGTEAWYYIRALRKRGFEPQFRHLHSFKDAPVPSVIGVAFSSRGHAVALLHKDQDGVELGDPRSGRHYYKWSTLPGGYCPDGLCITIGKRN